jgi:hypothetical protein
VICTLKRKITEVGPTLVITVLIVFTT